MRRRKEIPVSKSKKSDYLKDAHVKAFCDFLAKVASSDELQHQWKSRRLTARAGSKESSAQASDEPTWKCSGLINAAKLYKFDINSSFNHLFDGAPPSGDLRDNSVVLSHLQNRIRAAKANKKWDSFLLAAIETQVWGGVEKNIGGVISVFRDENRATQYLKNSHDCFGNGTKFDLNIVSQYSLRSNAGFTKIYSLLYDDFAIYDSRVAAALGMLVVQYCQERVIDEVPKSLQFVFMSGQSKALRDPSIGTLRFKKCPPTGLAQWKAHIWSNVRLNWVLSEVASRSDVRAKIEQELDGIDITPLRALEAGLFMVGYDLSDSPIYAQRGTAG